MAIEKAGWVYIVTNRPDGILYVGVTSNLPRRAWEHREGVAEGFTKRYALKRLVYIEQHDDMLTAIVREKAIKTWRRAWKVRLIRETNPDWDDLYDTLNHDSGVMVGEKKENKKKKNSQCSVLPKHRWLHPSP